MRHRWRFALVLLAAVTVAAARADLGDRNLSGTVSLARAAAAEATTTSIAATTSTSPPRRTPVPPPRDPYPDTPYRVVGTIVIPKLGLRAPIGEGVSLTIIDRGPAHWPGSAMPGEPGNVVIAGHRVTHTHPFRHIDALRPGDQVIFEVDGRRSVYVMTRSEVVQPTQVDIVRQTTAPTATLFA